MKKFRSMIFTAIAAAVMLSAGTFAQESAETRAGEAYRNGNFEEAVSLYRELARQAPHNPYYYYNLANSYYKTNKPGRAVANYYKAFSLLPRDSDIRHNLAFAMNQAGTRLVPEGIPETLFNLFSYFSRTELKGLTLLSLWAFIFLLMFYSFWKNARPHLMRALVFAAFVTIVCGGWYLAQVETSPRNPAVVVDGIGELRTGPGDNFGAAATVPEGHVVDIISANGEWYEIGLPKEGLKGWINKKFIEPAGI
ncbi:MAG: SH3 domain-containing protein [Elusimicrobiaceae bacterium]